MMMAPRNLRYTVGLENARGAQVCKAAYQDTLRMLVHLASRVELKHVCKVAD